MSAGGLKQPAEDGKVQYFGEEGESFGVLINQDTAAGRDSHTYSRACVLSSSGLYPPRLYM